jgi:ribonucleotide reductase beta subunit family protein with ferritin-like domain
MDKKVVKKIPLIEKFQFLILNYYLYPEPLLKENKDRYVLFPIKYPDIYELYKLHMSVFWTREEIDFKHDSKHWQELKEEEQHFLSYVLAFFASSDGIVLENLAERFIKEIQIPEVRCFYGFQIAMENIHSETYSAMIDLLIPDIEERDKLFHALETIPAVQKKANWAIQWISSEATFAERLIAFSIVEGIFFSASFCAIYWVRSHHKKLPGLTFSNDLIARDEGLHCKHAKLLYTKYIKNKLSQERIEEMMKDAVNIEKEFVCSSLPWKLKEMNSELMSDYVEYMADRHLNSLGYKKIYNKSNPFQFMELISLPDKTNFFEKRVQNYSKFGVGNTDKENNEFTLDASF